MANKPNNSTETKNTITKSDLLASLHDSACVMESLIMLTRHYRNELADDVPEAWVGLSIILGGVLETLVDAREALDLVSHNSR